MYDPTYATALRVINVTSTTTAQTLGELLRAAIAAKNPAPSVPLTGVKQIAITSSATLLVYDMVTGDAITVAASTRCFFPVQNPLGLGFKNAATVNVELYYDNSQSSL